MSACQLFFDGLNNGQIEAFKLEGAVEIAKNFWYAVTQDEEKANTLKQHPTFISSDYRNLPQDVKEAVLEAEIIHNGKIKRTKINKIPAEAVVIRTNLIPHEFFGVEVD